MGTALAVGSVAVNAEAADAAPTAPASSASAPTTPVFAPAGTCGAPEPFDLSIAPAGYVSLSEATAAESTSSGGLHVMCALPYQRGSTGSDCNGSHTVQFSHTGSASAKVKAQLIALDAQGFQIGVISDVKPGEAVSMNSRLSPTDYKLTTKKGKYEVFAPLPMLKVVVEDAGERAEVYCTNVPYLKVTEPQSQVVTDASAPIEVVAMAPRTNPSTIDVVVDGVEVFNALGIANPAVCTVASPCPGGTIPIGTQNVSVTDIVVDVAAAINVLASNTVRMQISGLECGGHTFDVIGSAQAGALRNPTTVACLIDDLRDRGLASIFTVDILDPTPQEVLASFPITVTGEVCGGRPISEVQVNGQLVTIPTLATQKTDPALCTGVPGGALTCKFGFSTTLGATNLVADKDFNNQGPQSFDAGTNNAAAMARDEVGTRTFDNVVFAVGTVAAVTPTSQAVANAQAKLAQLSSQQKINDEITARLMPKIQEAEDLVKTEIQNAFVVGISAQGTQEIFNALCTQPNPTTGKTAGTLFKEALQTSIGVKNSAENPITSISVPVDCACDPTVNVYVSNLEVGNNISCPIVFEDGKFNVSLQLPDISIGIRAKGDCEDYAGPVCLSAVQVDASLDLSITGSTLKWTVTEANILQNEASDREPDLKISTAVSSSLRGNLEDDEVYDIDCLGSVCSVLLTIVTLGLVDFSPPINIQDQLNIEETIGAQEADPVQMNEIKIDESEFTGYSQQVSGALSSVEITTGGIIAGLKGEFLTTAVDPEVAPSPGSLVVNAPLPTLPNANLQDVFVGVQASTFNALFASFTTAGGLKSECTATGKVKNLLDLNANGTPAEKADCDTLTLDNDLATYAARGTCYAIANVNCESLVDPTKDAGIMAGAQGLCHAMNGANCETIPVSPDGVVAFLERLACQNTPNPNIDGEQNVLFCARQDLPPQLLLNDATLTQAVEASLRLNDLSVALVLDRSGSTGAGTGNPNGQLEGLLAAAPNCFGAGTNGNADCSLFATCLDLNFDFNMLSTQCDVDPNTGLGKPGFQFNPLEIVLKEDAAPGVVCGAGGATAGTDDTVVDKAQNSDAVTINLEALAQQAAPPICGANLDIGGLVSCKTPKLSALETGGDPNVREYLAISCDIQPQQ